MLSNAEAVRADQRHRNWWGPVENVLMVPEAANPDRVQVP